MKNFKLAELNPESRYNVAITDKEDHTTEYKTMTGKELAALVNGAAHLYNFQIETEAEKTKRENTDHCKNIAEDLEAYTDGSGYKCLLCGEVHHMTEYAETEHENGRGETCYTCPSCSEEIEESELEAVSIYDYFTGDIFDIEYRIGSDRQFRSVRLMVACGGPNIYIDTAAKAVQLYWWTDFAEYPISYSAVEAINAYFEELYNC